MPWDTFHGAVSGPLIWEILHFCGQDLNGLNVFMGYQVTQNKPLAGIKLPFFFLLKPIDT